MNEIIEILRGSEIARAIMAVMLLLYIVCAVIDIRDDLRVRSKNKG